MATGSAWAEAAEVAEPSPPGSAGSVAARFQASTSASPAPLPVSDGNVRRILAAARDALRAGRSATLAVVLETEGSTYSGVGTMALFGEGAHVGWLSGGCLEPEIERRARQADTDGRIGWLEIDTRDDDALLSGSATGCRGRQRMALLPLHAMPGFDVACDAWLRGGEDLALALEDTGHVTVDTATTSHDWRIAVSPPGWSATTRSWTQRIRRAPAVLLLGAGPEMPTLARLLDDLGWHVAAADRRPRWRNGNAAVMDIMDAAPSQALLETPQVDAVLVMHHDFELDREALAALATHATAFIGLLGPLRRRDDLLKLLPAAQRAAVLPRLRAPIGIDLGGRGAETIALSIATQLQAWRHGHLSAGPRTS